MTTNKQSATFWLTNFSIIWVFVKHINAGSKLIRRSISSNRSSQSGAALLVCLLFSIVPATALAASEVAETEPNNTSLEAQNLDGLFSLRHDDDIGDATTNTSQTIPHVTVLADGDSPVGPDIYSFTVAAEGKGIFDIDYGRGVLSWNDGGLARQTDGRIWIKEDTVFYWLDDQRREQFGFEITYAGTTVSALAVRQSNAQFYTIDSTTTDLVRIDPNTQLGYKMGITGIEGISALSFDDAGRLFAVTGIDGARSFLYELNPDNGQVIQIIGDTGTEHVLGLDFHPDNGVLYGLAQAENVDFANVLAAHSNGHLYTAKVDFEDDVLVGSQIWRIDTATSLAMRLSNLPGVGIAALAFDATDRLYATTGAKSRPSTLLELDPATGAILSAIGETGTNGMSGIDFQSGSNTLYGHANGPDHWNFNGPAASNSSGAVFSVGVGIDNQAGPQVLYSGDTILKKLSWLGELSIPAVTGIAFDGDDLLYAVAGVNSTLYRISAADGSLISEVGATGFDAVTGLSFHPVSGVLYAHANASNGQTAQLLTINTTTGVGTAVGPSNFPGAEADTGKITDLAFDTNDAAPTYGTLYGIHRGDDNVHTFNLNTGTSTLLGASMRLSEGRALAFADGVLYWRSSGSLFPISQIDGSISLSVIHFTYSDVDEPQLFTLNTTTGLATSIGASDAEEIITDLSFHGNGTLYGWDSGEPGLWSFDLDTGIGTVVGEPLYYEDEDEDGLAWSAADNEFYMKGRAELYTVNADTAENFPYSGLRGKALRLLTMSKTTANTTDIGNAWPSGHSVSDLAFESDGTLLSMDPFNNSLLTFDLSTGKGTAVWGLNGWYDYMDFTSDGQMWVSHLRPALHKVNQNNGEATFAANILGQPNGTWELAIDPAGTQFTFLNRFPDYPLCTIDPVTGALTERAILAVDATYLAFSATGALYGISLDNGTVFQIDPSDGSEVATIGVTGVYNMRAFEFDDNANRLIGFDSATNQLLAISLVDASTTVIATIPFVDIRTMAMAPNGDMFGWATYSNTEHSNSLVQIDLSDGSMLKTGAEREIRDSELVLLGTDGIIELGFSDSAAVSNGQLGSAAEQDPFLEYTFDLPGVYYIKVQGEGGDAVPLGASYELQVSVEGGQLLPSYTVGGVAVELAGSGLVLRLNNTDDLAVNDEGLFEFPNPLEDGSEYMVSVVGQPVTPSQNCIVSNGSGSIDGENVTSVYVECITNRFSVGGIVSGLTGTGLVLKLNGSFDLEVPVNGGFQFPDPLEDLSAYEVTVGTPPGTPSQTCSITNGSGNFAGESVSNVMVDCTVDQFTIGGTVSGLTGTGLVLQLNGGSNLAVADNGTFQFPDAQNDGSNYAVTVASQPSTPDQHCTVTNGTGEINSAEIDDVQVICSDKDDDIFADGFE